MNGVRGCSQIANICQQNMQPDKTALDICHACLRMCAATGVDTLNLHLDLLDGQEANINACADWLVKRLLPCTIVTRSVCAVHPRFCGMSCVKS